MGHQNVSPRVALNFHAMPQHTFRIGASVAHRTPALTEQRFPTLQPGALFVPSATVNSPGLIPEKLVSHEIGYLGEFRAIVVTVDAKAYYDRVSDIIFQDPSPLGPPLFDGKPYSFSNLLSATYRGFEGTLKYGWGAKSNLILNYSRQLASCDVSGTLREPLFMPLLQQIAASCSSMVPRNSGSVLLMQQITDNVQFSAGYYQQGVLQFLNTPAPLSLMRRLDLRVAKTFGRPNESGGGEVALVVQNALRNDYTEYSPVIESSGKIIFNRRAYLMATLGF